MFGKWLLSLLGALALAATLGACGNTGVQPGIVSTSSGTTATASTYGNAVPGEPGRVVAINEVSLAGSGGGGSGNGPLMGGILGAGSGAAIGAATSHSVSAAWSAASWVPSVARSSARSSIVTAAR